MWLNFYLGITLAKEMAGVHFHGWFNASQCIFGNRRVRLGGGIERGFTFDAKHLNGNFAVGVGFGGDDHGGVVFTTKNRPVVGRLGVGFVFGLCS